MDRYFVLAPENATLTSLKRQFSYASLGRTILVLQTQWVRLTPLPLCPLAGPCDLPLRDDQPWAYIWLTISFRLILSIIFSPRSRFDWINFLSCLIMKVLDIPQDWWFSCHESDGHVIPHYSHSLRIGRITFFIISIANLISFIEAWVLFSCINYFDWLKC